MVDVSVNPGTIELVFCVDRGALVGLHAALAGICSNVEPGRRCSVNLLHDGLRDDELSMLNKTVELASVSGHVKISPQEISIDSFQRMRNHVGHGWMTYARILAPEMIASRRLIYLDADLLVGANLADLWGVDLNGAPLGAASWSSRLQSNDAQFFQRVGYSLDVPYFNAGVLVFDAEVWREQKLTKKVLESGHHFGKNLPSADQTILNLVFGENFAPIPRKFNTPVSPSRKTLHRDDLNDRIIHLVARPKPWDAFGKLNGMCCYFDEILATTAMADFKRPMPSRKTLRALRAYLKCWRNSAYFFASK